MRIVFIFLLVTFSFAQFNETDYSTDIGLKKLSGLSHSISDTNSYNIMSHGGNPLGILEIEKSINATQFSYRYLKFKDQDEYKNNRKFHGVGLPYVRVGKADVIYFDLNYTINPTSIQTEDEEYKMPLHRFGFSLVGQIEDERFKIGLVGQGFYGKFSWYDAVLSNRVVLGGENIGICMGFKLHDAVSLDLFGHAAGFFDSLKIEKSTDQERFSWLQLPQVDVSIDVGMDDFPWMSNFLYSYVHHNFVYTQKPFTLNQQLIGGTNKPGHYGDADPLVCDSTGWHWQNLWDVWPVESFGLHPALSFGYIHSRYKHMKPNGDNYPINYDDDNPGYEWDIKSFNFGVGNTFFVKDIMEIWFEYYRATLKLDNLGEKLSVNFDTPENRGYNRIGFGFKTNFHNIPALSMPDLYEVYFTFGFLLMHENELMGTYRSQSFRYMYIDENKNSQVDRYQPWVVMDREYKTSNITFGLGASFINGMFDAGLHFGILRQEKSSYTKNFSSTNYKGFEFGLDIVYRNFGLTRKDDPVPENKAKINNKDAELKLEPVDNQQIDLETDPME